MRKTTGSSTEAADTNPNAVEAPGVFRLPLLTVTISTEDPDDARMALDYWQHPAGTHLPGHPVWTVKVTDLRARAKARGRSGRIDEYIRSFCVATYEKPDCAECGGSFVATSRYQLQDKLFDRCSTCVALSDSAATASASDLGDRPIAAPEPVVIDSAVARFFPVVETPVFVEDLRRCNTACLTVLNALARYAPGSDPIPASASPAWGRPLTPNYCYSYLRHAFQSGFLSVHPASDKNSFVWPEGEKKKPTIADIESISWYLIGRGTPAGRAAYIDRAVAEIIAGPWTLEQHDDVIEAARGFLTAEVEAYVEHRLFEAGSSGYDVDDLTILGTVADSIAERHGLGRLFKFMAGIAPDLPGQVNAGENRVARRTLHRLAGYAKWADEKEIEGYKSSPHDFPLSAATLTLFENLGFANPVAVTLTDVRQVAFGRLDADGRAKVFLRNGPSDSDAEAALTMLTGTYVPMVSNGMNTGDFPANSAAIEALLEVLGNTVDVATGHVKWGLPAGRALQIAYYGLDHLTGLLPNSYKPLVGDITGNQIRSAADEVQNIIERALTARLTADTDEIARLRTLT